jgi:hypothetical protein
LAKLANNPGVEEQYVFVCRLFEKNINLGRDFHTCIVQLVRRYILPFGPFNTAAVREDADRFKGEYMATHQRVSFLRFRSAISACNPKEFPHLLFWAAS